MDVFSSDKFATGTEMIAHYNGTVYWMTPLTIDSQCELNLRSYPFDEHECIISLGVSDYKMTEAAFVGKGGHLQQFGLEKLLELIHLFFFQTTQQPPWPDH